MVFKCTYKTFRDAHEKLISKKTDATSYQFDYVESKNKCGTQIEIIRLNTLEFTLKQKEDNFSFQ